ncbi:MAG: CDGSH iron-sulfur domain-containing protein [Bacteroidetes bacterium]|nr:CDGSH iron-sulfur domain-containing protein [Bacteroidota bacterium]
MDEKNATFTILANGPLEITGFFRIADSAGKIIEKKGPVLLCRCGESANKPFCDDSHKRIGFSE